MLTYADLVGEEATKELSVEDVMKEMDQFVGMNAVKDAIRRIAQEITVQKRLIELGEGAEGLTKFNFILTGNPGTGKTSVANTLGKIFYALGVTSTDRVTKKEPKDLISQFNNESAKVMDAAITEAMGGVLFIDEAYGLNPVDETGHGTNPEGKKALETLMTRMENEAGKFVVICAGYPKEMDDFLKANPGLPRRFSHRIHIDDYTAEELLEIYERAAKAKKYNFTLADEAVRMMHGKYLLQTTLDEKDEENIWTYYNVIRTVEETFKTLKSDLDIRPVYHKTDEASKAHLNLAVLAYWVVSTTKYILKKKGINIRWEELLRIMSTQQRVTMVAEQDNGHLLKVRRSTTPETKLAEIQDALGITPHPVCPIKSVWLREQPPEKYPPSKSGG